MLGVMFFLIQKHIPGHASATWEQLCGEAGLVRKTYAPKSVYPDAEMLALFQAASRLSQRPLPELLEQFGEAIAPDLIELHSQLIEPTWTTLDLLLNTERLIHGVVRQKSPGATPPVLQCQQTTSNEVQIVYSSRRQLCALARGIIRGAARHFQQDVEVIDDACMLQGDPFCALRVTLHSTGPTPNVSETQVLDIGGMNATPIPAARLGVNTDGTLPTDVVQSGRLAHYRILRFLGKGATASVYIAEDLLLGRQVALKIASREMALRPGVRQRFLREAQAMASVQSDHVVSIYQVGQHGDCPYIAMQLLEGSNLAQWRKQQLKISTRQVVRIGRQIALGLADIHDRGLVHRDIKPSNIWIEAPNERVKLLDLGLVRDTKSEAQLTQQGTILGTPDYMAPEQAAGLVTARCDLYSLGVVLYELITSRLPFQAENLMHLLTLLALETPREAQELNPQVPAGLNALVVQLLAKDPQTRPQTARSVVDSLDEIEKENGELDSEDTCATQHVPVPTR